MTDLMRYGDRYRDRCIPVKYFLNSYRALSDGTCGVRNLQEMLDTEHFLLSNWEVVWAGTCALLRAAITMFKVDAKSCIDSRLGDEIAAEWKLICKKEEHPIFWQFLLQERDNIMHRYEWAAYEMWMDESGNFSPPKLSLLNVRPENSRTVLLMRSGHYKAQDSLELLREGADWVEDRIYSAIRRAGYEPDEMRNIATFQKPPQLARWSLFDRSLSE